MSEENRTLVSRYLREVWSLGNTDKLEEFVASDYVYHGSYDLHRSHGKEGLLQRVEALRTGLPGFRCSVDELFSVDDRVVVRFTASGVHSGVFLGVKPTGRQVRLSGITIFRLSRGKIAEEWTNWSALGVLQQLGVIPVPEEGP